MLEALNAKNPNLRVPICSVRDARFQTYGRVVTGYDVTEIIAYLEDGAQMPDTGNVYLASVDELEQTAVAARLKNGLYGGMNIQIGYCNGRNSTFNGLEYHKSSEVTIAATDLLLILGHTWDIRDNCYRVTDAEVFFVAKGEAVELYQTTLHLSPCKVTDAGFRAAIVLPRGTNTPLDAPREQVEDVDRLLLQKNKWVIAHPEREPLIKQGAFAGILGENIELKY